MKKKWSITQPRLNQARQATRRYRQAARQLRGRVAWTAPVMQFLEWREGCNREVSVTTLEYMDAVRRSA
eukprot:12917310-Prorocentrum_lima.AAC.1